MNPVLQKSCSGANSERNFVVQFFMSQCLFIGKLLHGKARGKGCLILPNGTAMKGEFFNNRFKNGVVQFANGAKFEGMIDQNTFHFKSGCFTFKNGVVLKNLVCNEGSVLSFVLVSNIDSSEIQFNTSLKKKQRHFVTKSGQVYEFLDGRIIINNEKKLLIETESQNSENEDNSTTYQGLRTFSNTIQIKNSQSGSFVDMNFVEGTLIYGKQCKLKREKQLVFNFDGTLSSFENNDLKGVWIPALGEDFFEINNDKNSSKRSSNCKIYNGFYYFYKDGKELVMIEKNSRDQKQLIKFVEKKRINFQNVVGGLAISNPKIIQVGREYIQSAWPKKFPFWNIEIENLIEENKKIGFRLCFHKNWLITEQSPKIPSVISEQELFSELLCYKNSFLRRSQPFKKYRIVNKNKEMRKFKEILSLKEKKRNREKGRLFNKVFGKASKIFHFYDNKVKQKDALRKKIKKKKTFDNVANQIFKRLNGLSKSESREMPESKSALNPIRKTNDQKIQKKRGPKSLIEETFHSFVDQKELVHIENQRMAKESQSNRKFVEFFKTQVEAHNSKLYAHQILPIFNNSPFAAKLASKTSLKQDEKPTQENSNVLFKNREGIKSVILSPPAKQFASSHQSEVIENTKIYSSSQIEEIVQTVTVKIASLLFFFENCKSKNLRFSGKRINGAKDGFCKLYIHNMFHFRGFFKKNIPNGFFSMSFWMGFIISGFFQNGSVVDKSIVIQTVSSKSRYSIFSRLKIVNIEDFNLKGSFNAEELFTGDGFLKYQNYTFFFILNNSEIDEEYCWLWDDISRINEHGILNFSSDPLQPSRFFSKSGGVFVVNFDKKAIQLLSS